MTRPAPIDPVDFYEQVVLPALFQQLDLAFPDFGWVRDPRGWTATNRAFTKDRFDARPDRVVCHAPFGFLVFGGTAISWLAYVNGARMPRGREFVETVKALAERANVDAAPLERAPSPEAIRMAEERARRTAILEAFSALAQWMLINEVAGAAARAYLVNERGFMSENLDSLALGVCPPLAEIERVLVRRGFSRAEIVQAGLLPASDDGKAKIEEWPGRLVIPWRDARGQLATFAARDLTGTAAEKYLYLAGTRKAELVAFGLEVALRPESGARDELVLVEGLFDVLAFRVRGFLNMAAIGGAGGEMRPERWAALARLGVAAATLVLDNDPAGRQGTLDALANAERADPVPALYAVNPAELEEAKDPDEFVRSRSVDAFGRLVDQRTAGAVYPATVLLAELTPESPDAERRKAVVQVLDIVAALHGPTAPLDRDDIFRRTAERTGYSIDALARLAAERETRANENSGADGQSGNGREPRFRLFDDEEITVLPQPEPLVGEVIAVNTLEVLYGPPGATKSFLALDIALSVAAGFRCLGRSVRRGCVVYIAAEGGGGLRRRVRAWKQTYGAKGKIGVHFLPEAVNLLASRDVTAFIEALRQLPEPPILIVVDTLARCLPGADENSAKDVGIAIANLDRLRAAFGATVLGLHHSGKNADVERGSSALRAAADTMLAVTKDGDRVTLRCEKQKDGAEFADITLELVRVKLGNGEESCILALATEPVPRDQLKGNARRALRALAELFDEEGGSFSAWQRNSRVAETSLRRAIKEILIPSGYVEKPPERGGRYHVTAAGFAALGAESANRRGGDSGSENQGDEAYSQDAAKTRHGGDRSSPPPPPPPYRGGEPGGDGGGRGSDGRDRGQATGPLGDELP